jgi:hypothetical protein
MNHGLIALIALAVCRCTILTVRRETSRSGATPRRPIADRLVRRLKLFARWADCLATGADMGLLAFRKLKAESPIVLECQQQEELWSSK